MTISPSNPSSGRAGDGFPTTDGGQTRGPSRRRVWVQRLTVAALWIGALAAWRHYQRSQDLGATAAAQRFIDNVESAWWGVGAYVAVYLARPVVLFPASVLTVVGGILFGPIVGVVVVVIAANTSAMIAYAIGRSLGGPRQPVEDGTPGEGTDEQQSLIARWSDRLRTNSFETVLVMRLLFLPYDLVNYASGLLRIRPMSFLAATALGSLPGTVSFVLLGASLDRVDEGFGGIDPIALIAGLLIFVISLAGARTLKNKQRLDSS